MPRYTVICEWKDGKTEDSDEMVVFARTAAGAASRARKAWAAATAKWPRCRLVRVWTLTKKRVAALGL